VLLLDTNGTIPKLSPQLCWQKMEKTTSTAMVAPRLLLVRPMMRQNTPPSVWMVHLGVQPGKKEASTV
jgi:hypothetical protein